MSNPNDLFDAIQKGDRARVDELVRTDNTLLEAVDERGLSPILVAAYYQEPEIAAYLADRKVILTLHEACVTGRITHVIRLLARNPELVNQPSPDGYFPLGLAAFFGHAEIVSYLIAAGAAVNAPSQNSLRVTPLHSAAAGRHLEVAQILLKHGADPNARQAGGFTPLHAAAQNGHLDMIRQLLLAGADLQARADNGQTALEFAEQSNHPAAADLLREGITKRLNAARPTS